MTGAELLAYIRRKTHTTTATYSDADILIDVNAEIEEFATEIKKARETIWNITALDDLVASTTSRLYAFPEDILSSIIDVELMFVAGEDYVQAKPSARRHYNDVLQESVIIANFDNSDPEYFIRRKAIYILSGTIAVVVDGIKIVYDAFPAKLADLAGVVDLSIDPTTTTHGFPREFHKLLARKIIRDHKSEHNMKLNKVDIDFEIDFQKKLDAFSTVDTGKTIVAGLPVTDSDDGFNL